jgi:hypothetical protein
MVRSCSVVICSVYVLYDTILINKWSVTKAERGVSEEEGTGTTHAVVTEAEVMFLTYIDNS